MWQKDAFNAGIAEDAVVVAVVVVAVFVVVVGVGKKVTWLLLFIAGYKQWEKGRGEAVNKSNKQRLERIDHTIIVLRGCRLGTLGLREEIRDE